MTADHQPPDERHEHDQPASRHRGRIAIIATAAAVTAAAAATAVTLSLTAGDGTTTAAVADVDPTPTTTPSAAQDDLLGREACTGLVGGDTMDIAALADALDAGQTGTVELWLGDVYDLASTARHADDPDVADAADRLADTLADGGTIADLTDQLLRLPDGQLMALVGACADADLIDDAAMARWQDGLAG